MKKMLIALVFVMTGSFMAATVMPTPVFADACDDKGRILTLKPWYYGLKKESPPSDCSIVSPGADEAERNTMLYQIAFNIVEDLLHVVGYAAVGFIMYGGFVFMTSGGAPERAAAGRKTAMNAAIGLVIAIASVALVNLVRSMLGL